MCLNKSIFKALVGETKEDDYKKLDEFKSIDFNVSHFINLICESVGV